jgi:group I intron endonuclease
LIVYKAINLVNEKIYIGITTLSLKDRIYRHVVDVKRKDRTTVYFHNAILKYGIDNFDFIIIDKADNIEDLNQKEQYWIAYYQSTNKNIGYNLDSGGKCCKKSSSTKKKIGLKKKENWENPKLSIKMQQGLYKATEQWKIKSQLMRIKKICPICNKVYYLAKWETKNRKYCSRKCSAVNNDFYKYSSSNKHGKADQLYENIKNTVELWVKQNKEIIIQCPYNKIETNIQNLLQLIYEEYNIKDLRTITLAYCSTQSRKEFLKQLKLFCENIC